MAPFLPALIILLASIQVSLAVHFTNSEWDVQQNQAFLLQWAYDSGDPTDSAWHLVVWLGDGQFPLPDGVSVYNASSNANTTSYAFQPTCDTVKVGSNAFGIGFEQWGYQILSTSYSPVWNIQGWYTSCDPTTSSLSKGAKIAIGVTMSLLGICLAAVAFLYLRSRQRKRVRVGLKPVISTTPSQSIELQDTAHEEAIPKDNTEAPPPYAPRT